MKKITLFAISFLTIVLFSCKKDPVTPPAPQCPPSKAYNSRINIFDLRPASPFFNTVIANFRLKQTQNSCPTLQSSTTLLIQNNTANTISFDYNINLTLNFVSWNYQGVVSVLPNSSQDVGVINENPVRVDLAKIIVQCANIQYH